MNKSLVVQCILSLPKTLYFNLKVFPLAVALRLPVLVNYRVRFIGKLYKGLITTKLPSMGMVKISFPYLNSPVTSTIFKTGGKILVEGRATIQDGCEINVSGELTLGNNFRCNKGTKIDAKKQVVFGSDVLIGPQCYISDSDGHSLMSLDGAVINEDEAIKVGRHVWLGRGVFILKGSEIGEDCVVGAASVVNRKIRLSNVIIAGVPAKVVKESVDWRQ